jgi:hypothetical protein
MLDEYYQLRKWNVETGIPTREKLRELDLDYTTEIAAQNQLREEKTKSLTGQ